MLDKNLSYHEIDLKMKYQREILAALRMNPENLTNKGLIKLYDHLLPNGKLLFEVETIHAVPHELGQHRNHPYPPSVTMKKSY